MRLYYGAIAMVMLFIAGPAWGQAGRCPTGQAVIGLNGKGPPTCKAITSGTPVGPLNAQAYGLVGNGSTFNDTAWNTLWAAANPGVASSCQSIFFPPGNYVFNTTKQIDMNQFWDGCFISGSSNGDTNTIGGCATTLTFNYNPAPLTISGCSESGTTATCTTTTSAAALNGEWVRITGTSYPIYNTTCKVTSANASGFSCTLTTSNQTSATGGQVSDAIIFVADGMVRTGMRDICFVGAGTATPGSDGNQTFMAGATHPTTPSESFAGDVHVTDVALSHFNTAFAITGDMDGSYWEQMHFDHVYTGFDFWNTQSSPLTIVDPDFHADYDVMEFDGNAPSPSIVGGYMEAGYPSQFAGDAVIHWTSTFFGQATLPISVTGTHWETYGAGARLVRDDEMNDRKMLNMRDVSFAGDTATKPLIQITSGGMIKFFGRITNGYDPSIIELDSDTSVGYNNGFQPPPTFIWETDNLNAAEPWPTFKLCTTNSAPVTGCTPYAPFNGINDAHSPNYVVIGPNTVIANTGNSYFTPPSLTGGLTTQQLAQPTNLACTCIGGTGTTYAYTVAACDSTGRGGAIGCTAQTSEATCSGPSSLNTSTKQCTATWTGVPGNQFYTVGGRTSGAEAIMTHTVSWTFTDDGSISPGGTMPTVNTTAGLNTAYSFGLPKLSGGPGYDAGAGQCVIFAVAGTNAGTCKLEAICGSGTNTPTLIADNIGSGC